MQLLDVGKLLNEFLLLFHEAGLLCWYFVRELSPLLLKMLGGVNVSCMQHVFHHIPIHFSVLIIFVFLIKFVPRLLSFVPVAAISLVC